MKKRVLICGNRKFIQHLVQVLLPLHLEVETVDSFSDSFRRAEANQPLLLVLRLGKRDRIHSAICPGLRMLASRTKMQMMVIAEKRDTALVLQAKNLGVSKTIFEPCNARELAASANALLLRKKHFACLGGGTGLYHLLSGLKMVPNLSLTSIVSMSDDGGSSGRLRISHGILPPGDIRRSLVALSSAPKLMNQVIQHRFKKGDGFRNHSFGNLFLTALAEIKGSMPEAIRALSDILHIEGIVLPVTTTLNDLEATFEDGTVIRGESKIDLAQGRDPNLRIVDLKHRPEAIHNPDAYAAILDAHFVTIGPGDLFTSVISNLNIKGIREAISKTQAKIIYFCNLMTKPGETARYTALDHVREIIKYLGGDYLDYVFLSNTRLSPKAVSAYARKDQDPVLAEGLDQIRKITKAQLVVADLGHHNELVRHDSEKIKRQVEHLLRK